MRFLTVRLIKIISVAVCLLISSQRIAAQTIIAGVSPKGVVLHYEGPLKTEEITLFKNGKSIGSIKPLSKQNDFKTGIRKAEEAFPMYPALSENEVNRVFESLSKAATTEQIFMKYMLTVQIASQLTFIDPKGSGNDIYTAGVNEQIIPVTWDRRDTRFTEPALIPGNNKSWYGDIETYWKLRKGNPILFTRLFRKDHQEVEYILIADADYRMVRSGDSVAVIARDTTLNHYSYFNYCMAGFDFYGNATLLSDPMIADNLDNSTLPIAIKFSATETEDKSQVEIKWKIRFTGRVKSLILQRSLKSDTSFQIITHLSPADSIFFDNVVNPMEAVYYRLLIYDLKGLLDHTPTVPMVSHQKPVVVQPAEVNSEILNGHPVISWKGTDASARGFRVFRTSTIGAEPELVSNLIQYESKPDFSWTDSSAALLPGRSYHYSVVAESKGYVLSEFSDFTTVRIPVAQAPQVPVGLIARKLNDRTVFLAWNTQGLPNEGVSVYQVYRAENENGPWQLLNDFPLFQENSFVDTLEKTFPVVFYSVRSLGEDGLESAGTLPVKIDFESARSGIPYLLARAQSDGIELQWPVGDKRISKVKIERGNAEGSPTVIGVFPCETGKMIDMKTEPGNMYYYRIISILDSGEETLPGNWVGASR